MGALIQETQIAFGRVAQSDLATANNVGQLVRFLKLNAAINAAQLNTEDDAAWIGKNHEFATVNYKTAWDVSGQLEKIASAEFLGWALAFALGKSSPTGGGPTYSHAITLLDSVADGIDLPPFSFVEQIRPGSSPILDRMAVGCAVEDMTLSVTSGPSLQNCKVVVNFVGTGKLTEPSGITIPPATAENMLRAAGITFEAHEENFVAGGQILSLELSIKNNIRMDTRFFPGSGFQTPGNAESGAIGGRMEHGSRVLSFKFSARFDHDSPQVAALLAQSTGTVEIGLTGGNGTRASIILAKTAYKSVQVNNADGIVSAESDMLPLWHASNGLISATVVNTLPTLGQA